MRDVFALGFPGQGSDWSTTVSVLAQHSSHELAQELGRRTGVENFADIDPADTLHAQPAIYTASMIGSSLLSPERYAATIGHSFGELAALVCAGVFEPSDGLSLAIERGRLGAIAQQNNPGAMVAVMASTLEAVEDARRSCGEGPDAWLEIAVINHPSQVVLSGDPASVNRIVEHFSATSARTLVLPIGGPFHTSAMAWAAIQYEQFAREIPTKPPTKPMVFSSGGGMLSPGQPTTDVAKRLGRSLVAPVDWPDTVRRARSAGITAGIDGGPGNTLVRISKRAGMRFVSSEPDPACD